MRNIVLATVAGALVGCSPTDEADNQANASVNSAAQPKRAAYCFFKDDETRGWSAAADAQGNVVVKGKAYRSDPRYMAVLGEPQVVGSSAEIAPSIGPNTTGFAAPENWWDVSATIPNSTSVTTVSVRCGKKVLAELPIKRKA
jgi:hypothetical protein